MAFASLPPAAPAVPSHYSQLNTLHGTHGTQPVIGGVGIPSLGIGGCPSLSGASRWDSLFLEGSSMRSPSLGSGSILQAQPPAQSRSPGPRNRMVHITRSVSPGPNGRSGELGPWRSQQATLPQPMSQTRDRSFSPGYRDLNSQQFGLNMTPQKSAPRDSSLGGIQRRAPVPVHASSAWDETEAPTWGIQRPPRTASPAMGSREVLRSASPAQRMQSSELRGDGRSTLYASGGRAPPHSTNGTSTPSHWAVSQIPLSGERSRSPSCSEARWQSKPRTSMGPMDRSASPASHRTSVPMRMQPTSCLAGQLDHSGSVNLGSANIRNPSPGNAPRAGSIHQAVPHQQVLLGSGPSSGSRSPRNRLPTTSVQWGQHAPLPQPFQASQGLFASALQEAVVQPAKVRVRSSSANRVRGLSPKATVLDTQQSAVTSPLLGRLQQAVTPRETSPREEVELRAGAVVRIGDCVCNITNALGMGSFGAVWSAEGPDGADLAVKEILCRSQSELQNALFESHLLSVIGGGGGNRSLLHPGECQDAERSRGDDSSLNVGFPPLACAGLVPTLVACGNCRIGSDSWRVRLAMTRLPGEPLDVFLEERRRQLKKEWRQLGGSEGASAVALCRRQYIEACSIAREMLIQLAPVFEQISAIAFHRDVNSHNILIDYSGGVPRYGLVDFGLAVDSICWRSEEGSGIANTRPSRVGRDGVSTWHYLDVGGDCRYWPLSAWMQFLAGWRELEACPSLSFEYQMQLDLHALGITVMQVLAELLPAPQDLVLEAADGSKTTAEDAYDIVPPEVWKLRHVWDRYWNRVSPLHGRLIDTFHNGGDWNALKMDCITTAVHDKLAEDLRLLRMATRDALDACRVAVEASAEGTKLPANAAISATWPPSLVGLLAACLILISDGQGEDTLAGPYAWQVISSLVAGDDRAPPKACSASNCSTTASTVACQVLSPDLADDGRLKQNASVPYLLLPKPRRVEGAGTPPRSLLGAANAAWNLDHRTVLKAPPRSPSSGGLQASPLVPAPLSGGSGAQIRSGSQPRENLVRKLSDLKDKVDWLAQEMARLGEKRDDSGHVVRQSSRQ